MLRCVVLLAVSTLSVNSSAHAQGVTGHWTAQFDSDVRTDRDTVKVLKRSGATLDLVQRGDSVTGVWRVANLDSTAVRGTFDGRSLKLTSGTIERAIKFNGQPTTMKVRTDIMGVVEGTKVSGTMFIYLGDRPPAPRRWEGGRLP